ncbi:signal peptidase II [Clostridium guangxiense]|uniref:signal peptidase II n=1 Tax=Clostridium guangxiense TaxID=1662055 RepID=UPI001E2DAA94|nr:signal peptidase II [Clostridium guangxiense]MCD2345187.1 signal peptidase II [Clostridium guangxiense]
MELVVIIIGFLLDRVTKLWAVSSLKDSNEMVIIKGFFSLTYVENKGAAWNIFTGKTIFLIVFTFVILCGVVFYLIKYRSKNKFMTMALSIIIAGALGNLVDRTIYKHVVDFILFHYKDVYYFPVFNIADVCVVVGTFLLLICMLRDDKKK